MQCNQSLFSCSGDWNLYVSSKQYLSFHFYFLRESEIYKLLLNNTRSASSYIMNSEVYKLPFDDAHISVCPPSPSSPRRYSKIYKVSKTNKQKNFIINIRLLCRWEFHKWLMNISKKKHKGGRYEAGSFFRNIEFIVITQEHGETLIYGLVCPWPHSLGSLVLLSCKNVSLGFFFFFLLEIHLTLCKSSSGYTSLLFHGHFPPLSCSSLNTRSDYYVHN